MRISSNLIGGTMKCDKEAYLIRRAQAIEYLGGKCVDCGFSDSRALQFAHVTERRDGRKTVASMLWGWWKWERVVIELDKCQLRCANCHMIQTASEPLHIRGTKNQYSAAL